MIVDWAKHCENIFTTKMLAREDPSDNKSYHKQEIIYLKFLRDVGGYSDSQCFQEWKALKNGTAAEAGGSDDATLKYTYDRIRDQSVFMYKQVEYKKRLAPVHIYQKEVDFLNGIDAPVWIRQYWLVLLVYYKFVSQLYSRVYKSPTLNSWSIRQTEYKDKRFGSKCQDKISKCQIDMGEEIMIISLPLRGEKHPSYVPKFIETEGAVARMVVSMENVGEALDLIQGMVGTCTECGATFPKNPKTKRNLCEKCYRKMRLEYFTQEYSSRKERQKGRNP